MEEGEYDIYKTWNQAALMCMETALKIAGPVYTETALEFRVQEQLCHALKIRANGNPAASLYQDASLKHKEKIDIIWDWLKD